MPTIETLKFIAEDYLYSKTTQWEISQDIQNVQSIACMEFAEQFVESVAISDVLPFVFDKFQGEWILKEKNYLGELFYGLLRLQNEIVINSGDVKPFLKFSTTFKIRNCDRKLPAEYKYEVSENSKILSAVASNLNLKRANFSGNPMSTMGIEGLLEGELINSFVIRLREATNRESFKKKVAERNKKSTQSFTKAKRYIERLYANYPALFCVRIAVCYKEQYENMMLLEKSAHYLTKFLEAFETDLNLGSPVGWFWKREYITEVGYRYYLFVFFDGQKTLYDPMNIQFVYGSYWQSVTGNQGTYFIPPVPEMVYKHSGTELPGQGYSDSLESVLSSIKCMFMRDILLRLERTEGFDHFGIGKLPRSANYKPATNSSIQTRRYLSDTVQTRGKNKKSDRLDRKLCEELYCKKLYKFLFDRTKLHNSEFIFKTYADSLFALECFIDEVLSNDEPPFVACLGEDGRKDYAPAALAVEYFGRVRDFIEVVEVLSPLYEYSEGIKVFITCSHAMGLQGKSLDWRSIFSDPQKINPRFNASAAEIFNTLVKAIRCAWKTHNTQAKINKWKSGVITRHKAYSKYVESFFDDGCTRLMVLQIDVGYKKQYANSIKIADIKEDLTHLFINKRCNSLFRFRKGYIAKLEDDVDTGIFYHLLFFLDDSEGKTSSHIHSAKDFGEYWETTITKGRGDYWFGNYILSRHDALGRCGIWFINFSDADLRKKLTEQVVGNLFKVDQFFKSKAVPDVNHIRRGDDLPKKANKKRGRPCKVEPIKKRGRPQKLVKK